jgi:hypothetical protein
MSYLPLNSCTHLIATKLGDRAIIIDDFLDLAEYTILELKVTKKACTFCITSTTVRLLPYHCIFRGM